MEKAIFKIWAKSQIAKQAAKDKMHSIKETLLEEDGGSEGIIIAVILIIIAVALAIIFREHIGKWINSLLKQGDEQMNTSFGSVPGAGAEAAAGATNT